MTCGEMRKLQLCNNESESMAMASILQLAALAFKAAGSNEMAAMAATPAAFREEKHAACLHEHTSQKSSLMKSHGSTCVQ